MELKQGDCIELMKDITTESVDMVLCDLPYETTDAEWDNIIPLEKLWEQYKRIVKTSGGIVLTAREPFTSKLVMSNLEGYKHKLVWNKKQSGSFANAKYMPLQIEEDILVFTGKGEKANYYPIMRKGKMRKRGGNKRENIKTMTGIKSGYVTYSDEYFPTNIIEIPNCSNKKDNFHPTQKPVELFEYLIKLYSKEGDLILDNCMGSGTTAIACINTKRNFIGFELNKEYFEQAKIRIQEASKQVIL